jgi:hypothetical protein
MEDNISFCLTFRAYLLYMRHTRGDSEDVKNLFFKTGSLLLFF